MRVTVSAPGKITLLGEHAVVYGEPAIVSAIDRRVYVAVEPRADKSIRISAPDLQVPGMTLTMIGNDLIVETDRARAQGAVSYIRRAIDVAAEFAAKRQGVDVYVSSQMPVGAGLGTSAAVSIGVIAAYLRMAGQEVEAKGLAKLGHSTEEGVQGAASPMDTAISVYGGTIYLKPSGQRQDPVVEPLIPPVELPYVLGYTERESNTGDLVARVRRLRESYPDVVDPIIKAIGRAVEGSRRAIAGGDLSTLGSLMNINQGLLASLGVSTKKLSEMIYSARTAGALGAKLTGAGGGGCMIALCPGKAAEVTTAIGITGGRAFQTSLSAEGLRYESVEP